jgi:archaellum component FlaC
MNENQFGVILEDIRDMFKTLAEGQKVIEESQNALTFKIEKEVDRLERKIDNYMKFTADVSETVTDHENRITTLEETVGV